MVWSHQENKCCANYRDTTADNRKNFLLIASQTKFCSSLVFQRTPSSLSTRSCRRIFGFRRTKSLPKSTIYHDHQPRHVRIHHCHDRTNDGVRRKLKLKFLVISIAHFGFSKMAIAIVTGTTRRVRARIAKGLPYRRIFSTPSYGHS